MEAINFNANINNETVPELPPEQKSRNLYEDRGSSLDPYCELTHSLQLSFFHFFKYSWVGLDEQRPVTKLFDGCFHLLAAGSQSRLTSVWTSLASGNISCWWTQFVNCIVFDGMCRNSHSAETSKTDSGWRRHDTRNNRLWSIHKMA